ncbi:MAG: PDZ domain-containing protein [Gemmatimonadetes bacterium]|nr:PDZ domain-containing protein [Gemmatimonadota bacterium]
MTMRSLSCALLALAVAGHEPASAAPIAQTEPVAASAPTSPSAGGWLGLRSAVLGEIDGTRRSDARARIRIVDVFRGGPADRAGLRPGDEVVRLNGSVVSPQAFERVARRLQPGDPVSLRVRRDDGELDVALHAAARPRSEVLVPVQLQRALDSTRQVFVRRLDSAREQITATITLEAPTFELRRIDADSVRAFVVHGDGPTGAVEVTTSGGLFEYEYSVHPRVGSPEPFTVWVRAPTSIGYALQVDTLEWRFPRVIPTPSPALRTTAPPPPGAVAVRVGSSADAPPAPVRPLAPYLAGMNRVAGAEFTPLVGDLATYFQAEDGLLVTDVADGTPAAEAGLTPGDVIVEARGRPVPSIDALRAALSVSDAPATLSVVRRGQRVVIRLSR